MTKIIDTKEEVIELLKSTKREGINDLITWMERHEFFTSPASAKYHGNYNQGLMIHSIKIYYLFKELCNEFGLIIDEDTIIICSLGHDLCKAGFYKFNYDVMEIVKNDNHPDGHAKLSISILERHIKLNDIEKSIILYHMGMYGTKEFGKVINKVKYSEYTLKELSEAYNINKLAKLFYFCDDMSSMFLEK
jgi:hypothetical protein